VGPSVVGCCAGEPRRPNDPEARVAMDFFYDVDTFIE